MNGATEPISDADLARLIDLRTKAERARANWQEAYDRGWRDALPAFLQSREWAEIDYETALKELAPALIVRAQAVTLT